MSEQPKAEIEIRLPEEVERAMAGLYSDIADADSWAANALRRAIRAYAKRELGQAITALYGDGYDDEVGMIA